MRAFLLETGPLDACSQMAMDEAILDLASPDSLTLRLYRWPGQGLQAVTFGFSQAYEDVAGRVRAKAGGVACPLIRRSTGGGVVYHDGDVTFSFVFPWARLAAPSLVYKNIHVGVHLGLKARGLPARLWSPARKPPSGLRTECFSGPETADLVHEDGRKCLGGALRRRSGMGLYQGSLRPEGFGVGADALRGALIEGFGLQWGALFEPQPPRAAVAARAAQLVQERYRTDRWNKRR